MSARKHIRIPATTDVHRRQPWTEAERRELCKQAGVLSARQIGQRLGRTECAVRWRLGAEGLSAKVQDGWALRSLQRDLHLGRRKLVRWIVTGVLRVRDARVTSSSLATFCSQRAGAATTTSRSSSSKGALGGGGIATSGLSGAGRHGRRNAPDLLGYSCKQAAKRLGATLAEVQAWIARGQLKLMDTRVSETAFQRFCRQCRVPLSGALLDTPTRNWLRHAYDLELPPAGPAPVAAAERHLKLTRTCPHCGRRTRGNAHYRHLKRCRQADAAGLLVAGARTPSIPASRG